MARIRLATTALVLAIVSCACEGSRADGRSELGFFASPDEIIAKLNRPGAQAADHFMVGTAYKHKKKYWEAARHFCSSAFVSRRYQNPKNAFELYAKFLKEPGARSPYFGEAVFEVASLAHSHRETAHAADLARTVPRDRSATSRDAVILASRALAELSRIPEALGVLQPVRGDFSDPVSQALIGFQAAGLLEKQEQYDKALAEYIGIMKKTPDGWGARTAAGPALSLITKRKLAVSVPDRILLSRALCRAGKAKEALNELEPLDAQAKNSAAVIELRILCHARNRDSRQAESLIKNTRDRKESDRLWMLYADELRRVNKPAAIAEYQKIITAENSAAGAAWKGMCQLITEKTIGDHEKFIDRYKDKFPGIEESENVLWCMAKKRLKAGKTTEAETLLKESVKRFPSGKHSDRARYWLSKLYEEKKDTAEQAAVLRDMAWKNINSSFTWQALDEASQNETVPSLTKAFQQAKSSEEKFYYHVLLMIREHSLGNRNRRLGQIGHPDKGKYGQIISSISNNSISSAHAGILRSLDKYFALGNLELIRKELKRIPDNSASSRDVNIALGYYGKKYRATYFTVHSILNLLRDQKLPENTAVMPDELLKLLYPTPFLDCVEKSGREFKIDIPLIYAVMKAESLFNPKIVSRARAVGLMQLMPATAKEIARKLKIDSYRLDDPCISIRLGTYHLAWLSKYYKDDRESVIAAYNAGSKNVNRWKKRGRPSDPDYFREFLPFLETQFYLLRTAKFYHHYQLLYGSAAPRK